MCPDLRRVFLLYTLQNAKTTDGDLGCVDSKSDVLHLSLEIEPTHSSKRTKSAKKSNVEVSLHQNVRDELMTDNNSTLGKRRYRKCCMELQRAACRALSLPMLC